ncbi:hypothetical protein D9M70_227970 [compost metagenome]
MRHPQALPRGDQGVAQLVQGLGQDQRQGEADQPLGGERFDHRVGEAVPLLQDQHHAEQAEQDHQPGGQRTEQPVEMPGQALQVRLRAQQRDAEEQVVVQPPFPGQPLVAFALRAQAGHRGGIRAQQLVLLEKLPQCQHLLHLGAKGRLLGDLPADLPGRALPAQQAFELQPADAVETVDHRIVDHPAGFAAGPGSGLAEAQVFAQGGRRQVGGIEHHQPLQARSAASGRRSR